VFQALRETIRAFEIPPEPFQNLLAAFEQDQCVKSYATFESLLQYCRHSANPVGRLVLYLGRAFEEEKAALSDHICTGLQLANFWQDVARDLDKGRVYLPEEDLVAFGYSREELSTRRFTPLFRDLLRFQVDRTRVLFQRGLPLVRQVPSKLRTDVDLFVRGGLAILHKIEQQDYNVLAERPVLSRWQKGRLLMESLLRGFRGRG
jgi:squalene synthase HpnC